MLQIVFILTLNPARLKDGLVQLSVDTAQASKMHHSLRMEVTWRENVKTVKQEAVRYGSLPIVLDGILTQTANQEETLRRICDMIKTESENNFQIYEVLDVGNNEKSNKNKIAAFINNKSNFSKVLLTSSSHHRANSSHEFI